MDKHGRIFLPVELRRALGLEPGERMRVAALAKGRRVVLVDLEEIAEGMAPPKRTRARRGKTSRR